jgi:hypothetical protein
LFTFMTPKVADAAEDDCITVVITCSDGSQHIVVCCGSAYGQGLDWAMWHLLLCDECPY